jgi:hypothetical protein
MKNFTSFKTVAFSILTLDITNSEKFGLIKRNYKFLKGLCHPHDHNQRRMMTNFNHKIRRMVKDQQI